MDSYNTLKYYEQYAVEFKKQEISICCKPFEHLTIDSSSDDEQNEDIGRVAILSAN